MPRPTDRSDWDRVPFTPLESESASTFAAPEWGQGALMYLWIEVQDTGCGLTSEQQSNLFTRFKQATPKTHIQYGGSGLGLFISRSLTACQGGSIGVRSEAGVGSTFPFFVTTRLAVPSPTDGERRSSLAASYISLVTETKPSHSWRRRPVEKTNRMMELTSTSYCSTWKCQ